MRKPFREHHLFELLKSYENADLPIDLCINHYFRSHKALGSKDRAYIAETTYFLIRWKALVDYLIPPPVTLDKRLEFLLSFDWKSAQDYVNVPDHIRVSCPEFLFQLLVKHYGEEKAKELCLICNTPAPTTVRANTLKIERDALLDLWKETYEVIPCEFAENGITFLKKLNFFTLEEFKKGFFEVQDEGSQLLANLIKPEKGQLILDYCAGAGGKTLCFAPFLQNSGQIYLHDIRKHALIDAKKRLKRAGVQNAQIIEAESPNLKKLKKKMDWVLVDAPCTGTGTLRRNPDMKWKFDEALLKRLMGQQRTIFEKALSYMKPSGRIVYGTCSVLPEENEQQLEHFMKTYNLQIEGEPFKSLPSENGMDGFFGVVLKS